MTAAFATVAGVPIVKGSLVIPNWGMWSADVSLATDAAVPSNVSVVVGNLTLQGNVYRQAPFAGLRWCRLVAGFGGWRKNVVERQYGSNVTQCMVVSDAATEVGEKIGTIPSLSFPSFVRPNDVASRVLWYFFGKGWRIDTAGLMQPSQWPSTTVTTDFQVIDQFGGEGRVVVATEDYASWVPGATFTATTLATSYTASTVRHVFESQGKSRVEVLTS